MTAIGMAVVMMTALVTGLVVASWSRPAAGPKTTVASPKPAPTPARIVVPARGHRR
jgi:hypothetical protein